VPPDPYRDTSVTASRSKDQISQSLRSLGARGMQLDEEWDENGAVTVCRVRFMYPTEEGAMLRVRFQAHPLPPEIGARGGWKTSPEQRERQCWRGLAWYIDSMVKAAAFGFVKFEEIFLAYFEDSAGRTIGERLVPEIEHGRVALPRGSS
jgi:hypothetical protein